MSGTEIQSDDPKPVRLYIAPLSQSLVDNPSDFVSRLAHYGKVLDDFSIHKKPTQETSFGFITLELTNKSYYSLRKALNGSKFKGHVLHVEKIKAADYETRRKEWLASDERAAEKAEEDLQEKAYEIKKSRSKKRKAELVLTRRVYLNGRHVTGKMRIATRDYRKQPISFRVRIRYQGKAKVFKCKKEKLWGQIKDESVDSYVWEFVPTDEEEEDEISVKIGEWLNGKGQVVEVLKHRKRVVPKIDPSTYDSFDGDILIEDGDIEIVKSKSKIKIVTAKEETEEERIQRLERENNLKLIQNMFAGADDGDSRNSSPTNKNNENGDNNQDDDDDDDEFYEKLTSEVPHVINNDLLMDVDVTANVNDEVEHEQEEESDDGELFSKADKLKAAAQVANDEARVELQVNDTDEERQQQLQQEKKQYTQTKNELKNEKVQRSSKKKKSNKTVATEKLRSLFNPENEKSKFSLFDNDSESDHDNEDGQVSEAQSIASSEESEQNQQNQEVEQVKHKPSPPRLLRPPGASANAASGFFFHHKDSHFLSAQSQFSKVPDVPGLSKEEFVSEFWDNRGDWTRKAKRRKRDVIRQVRKKDGNFLKKN
ncbi:hypothetical protein V1514DRAFT_353077 [Lipomyces japonicus]|uniref:uncharacterized protein n=1 Tax=Lipomyces japonicus TaxID=56871 RepID=UPI0034CE9967